MTADEVNIKPPLKEILTSALLFWMGCFNENAGDCTFPTQHPFLSFEQYLQLSTIVREQAQPSVYSSGTDFLKHTYIKRKTVMNVKETIKDIRGQTADSGVCTTAQSLCEWIVCGLVRVHAACLYTCPLCMLCASVFLCGDVLEQCRMTHAGMCRHSPHQTSNILQTFHKTVQHTLMQARVKECK